MKFKTSFKKARQQTRLDRTLRQADIRIPTIKLGFFSTATYAKKPYPSVPFIARILDKGYIKGNRFIPPRPFLSNLYVLKKEEWKQYFDTVFNEEYTLHHDIAKATQETFNHMAVRMKKDLKDRIRDIKTPPNAPSTIKKKGSSNPLIDTGFLRNNAAYKIIK